MESESDMLTGYENMTNSTLVKSYKEVVNGPMSTKSELIAAGMKKELDKRRVAPNHPAFSNL